MARGPSEHFTWHEFACHDGTPAPGWAHDDLIVLCAHYLEPLRRAFGPVRIVSGYRDRIYNAHIGGAPESFHIYQEGRPGAAADVTCRAGTPREWHSFLEHLAAPGLGYYPTHVHVDTRRHPARW